MFGCDLIKKTKRKKKKIKKRGKHKLERQNKVTTKLSIIIFLITLYILIFIFGENNTNLEQYQAAILPEIKSYEKNINLNPEVIYEFRKINCDNKLIEENPKFEKSKNPDVSVIMIIYNQAHCIYKGIRSIQNQSLKNIEIILVDGCSQDNSTEVIKEFQKEDPRIILIAHDTNKGMLNARVDGVREAKGKYITILDGDDALSQKDILKNCLFIAQKGKFDVVEFKAKGFRYGKPVNVVYDYTYRNASHIIYQPELKTKFLDQMGDSNNNWLFNRVIWGKFIENKFFKKVIQFIGPEYTDDFINGADDTLLALSVFRLAKSYYITNEMGYYCSYDEKNGQFPKLENKVCKVNNKIKNLGYYKFFKFVINKIADDDKLKIMEFTDLSRLTPHLENRPDFDDRHYKVISYVHDKMLEWNCLNKGQKDYIIKLKDQFKRN